MSMRRSLGRGSREVGTAIAKAQRQESLAAQVQPRGREAGEQQVEGGRELGGLSEEAEGGGGQAQAGQELWAVIKAGNKIQSSGRDHESVFRGELNKIRFIS